MLAWLETAENPKDLKEFQAILSVLEKLVHQDHCCN